MKLNGLKDTEVEIYRKKYGTNKVNDTKQNSFLSLFLESFGDPIIKILLIALSVKIVLLFKEFDWFETLGILIAIFLASFISSISEYGSEKAFKKLQEESKNILVKVKRNNKLTKVSIEDIVVNDIVYLESGDLIPADGIILKGNILVDESALNGETKERELTINNEILKGSIVCDGECIIRVTKVGKNTIYGNIETEIMTKTIDSPLRTRLNRLAKIISRIGYIGSILVVISYLFSKIVIENNFDTTLIIETLTNPKIMLDYLIYSLTLSVTVIIVCVPEGLPMMVALVLSSNIKRMLNSNVLVRKMVGIETSGNINILFTDKTGTITSGKLIVKNLLNYNGEICNNKEYKKQFIDALLYNNQSTYSNNTSIGGNTTNQAIMNYLKLDKVEEFETITTFNSKNKYSCTKLTNKNIYYFKGANEKIIEKCDFYLNELGEKKLLRNNDNLYEVINTLTEKGLRVISVAYKQNNSKLSGLCFVGFVVIKDEIRENASYGLKLVSEAGIKTVMITGDDPKTAKTIGEEIGLLNEDDLVITSEELNKLNDEEVSNIIDKLKIVARALPKDKSRLVKICQKKGLVVGMTGDGVNDAPALKIADVGFAMGSGTEIAKESSDIVILDNNLVSISNAILYGRTIYKSIRKFIIYQLTVNCCALILSIIGPIIGISSPITIIQMLWINMIMDTLSGLAFSYEPALLKYMKEQPKKRDESIINKYMYSQIITSGIYSSLVCLVFLSSTYIKNIFRYHNENIYFMTGFFALFIFMGIFNAFNSRTTSINIFKNINKNKIFITLFLLITIVQIFLIYYGGNIFRTFGLNSKELLIVLLLSISVIPIDMIRKKILKQKNKIDYI